LNNIKLFEGQEVKVKTDKGATLINLVHVAKCCGLTQTKNNIEYVRWTGKGVGEKLKLILSHDCEKEISKEINYILDEIENTDDRNSIYMSSWLSKRLALECHSVRANKFKDFLVTLDENREEQLSNPNETLELANYMLNIAQANQVTNEVVTGILKSVSKIQEYVQDSIQAKDQQIDQAMSLIGIRTKNVRTLSGKLKQVLIKKYGRFLNCSNIEYKNAKAKVFKEFKVYKWEEISVTRYNAVEAFIEEMF